ncbi:MAG TPA: type II toxin-antitoxin system HipA family toxin [Galbitalea sp.]|jgi:serine/threonine-protein kinase HipA|nr:type II toxin-antitoxin system HipA family toxin [Galbitalea sp.]
MRVELAVQLPDGREVTAGTIESIKAMGRTVPEFRYAETYLSDEAAYALSPELPLDAGRSTPRGARTMFGGIADAQPDSWGRRLIDSNRRREARKSNTGFTRPSEVDVLAAVPDATRQGALRVRDGERYLSGPSGATPTTQDLPVLIEMARAFEDGAEVPDEFQRLFSVGTSMGGARPKATVRRAGGILALAKLPRDDDFGDAMAWEATALELARQAGITVPRFEHHRFGPRSVLVIDRFDRNEDRRIGYLSADSLLVKQPNESIEYTMLAERLIPLSASPRSDAEELFRRIAFSLLINNVDDHMKNHGVLRVSNGWSLSPVFDVNPFYRQGAADSTPVSPNDDPNDRDIRNLLGVASTFDLTSDKAVEVIREVESATARWSEVASDFGISPEGAAAMSEAFENHNRTAALHMSPGDRSDVGAASSGHQSRTSTGRFGRKQS